MLAGGEGSLIGLIITPQGIAALAAPASDTGVESENMPAASPGTGFKQARLIALLSQEAGVSMDELTETFGWLPHSTRAVISGLRKKGHSIENSRQDGMSRYRLVQPHA